MAGENAKNKKVLIVEDDAMISSMYESEFKSHGYLVFLATNGADGIDVAKKQKPDIILLDVIMTQLDGFSVLAQLKEEASTKNIPVVMLTNLGTDEDKKKGEKLGAVDYLVKANFTPSQIAEKIKQYLK